MGLLFPKIPLSRFCRKMIKNNGYLLQEESSLRINLCSFSYERCKIYVPSLDAKKQTWGLGGKIEPLLRCLLRQKARRIEQFPTECRISSEGLLVFLLRSVTGLENSRHSFYQSDATLKQITNLSPAFSRALGSLFIFYFELSLAIEGIFLSSDWSLWLLWICFYDTRLGSALDKVIQWKLKENLTNFREWRKRVV